MGVTRVGVGPLLRTFQSQCSSSCHILPHVGRIPGVGLCPGGHWTSQRAITQWGTMGTQRLGDCPRRGHGAASHWEYVAEGLGVGAAHGEDKLDKGLGLGSTHERRVLGQAGGSTLHFVDGQTENRPGLGNPPPHCRKPGSGSSDWGGVRPSSLPQL